MSNKEIYLLLNQNHHYFLIVIGLVAGIAFFDLLASWHLLTFIGIALSPNQSGIFLEWQTTIIFMAGYLSCPVGAFLIGRYGDKMGRKPALMATFLILIAFTLMIGLLPTHQMVGSLAVLFLIIARFGQGMAFGLQFPLLWTYITEKLSLQHIGLGTGIIGAAAMIGGFSFFIILSVIENTLTQAQLLAYGWRLPFFMSGILGLLLLPMLKNIAETPVFLANQESLKTITPLPFFNKCRWKKTLPIFVLSWFIASSIIVMIFLLPALLEFSFPNYGNLLYTGTKISLFFLIIGCIFFGFLTDRTNAAKILAIGCICFMASLFALFYDLATGGRMLLLSFTLSGFFAGVIGATPAIMIRLIPMQYRLSNVALIYNVVYAFIGICLPIALGYTTFYAKYSPVVYMSFVCVVTLFLSFYLYYCPKNKEEIYRLN